MANKALENARKLFGETLKSWDAEVERVSFPYSAVPCMVMELYIYAPVVRVWDFNGDHWFTVSWRVGKPGESAREVKALKRAIENMNYGLKHCNCDQCHYFP